MASPLNISLKVTGLDQAKAELQTLATIGQRSFAQLEAQAQRLSARTTQTTATLTTAAQRVLQLTKAVDSAASANLSYRDSLVAINTALREGWINTAQQQRLTQALREEQRALATSIRAVTADIRQLGTIGTQGFNTIQSAANRAAAGLTTTREGVLTLAQEMRTLVRQINPVAAANQDLYRTLVRVKQALDLKVITPKESAGILTALQAEAQKTLTAIRAVKDQIKELNSLRGASTGDIQARATATTGTPRAGSQEQLDLATRMQGLAQAADPATAANQRLFQSLVAVRQAVDGYVISQQTAIRITAHLIEQHNAINTSIAKTRENIADLGTVGQRTYRSLETEAERLAQANQTAGQSYDALLKRVRDNIAAVNPLAAANQKLRTAISEVKVAQARGDVDPAQATDSIEKMTKAHQRWVAQQQAGLPVLNQSSLSTKQLGNVVTQFSFQMNDIATGLASGVSPFTILAQQGGQVIQVFQGLGPGGVTAVLAGFGTMLMKLLNPINLFIAGLVGVGVGIAALVGRATTADSSMRQFAVTLEGMNKTAQASPAGLEDIATSMHDVGVSAADARTQINDLLRAGVNPKFTAEIVRAGANLKAAFGGEPIADITKAFSSGALAAIDYGVTVRAVSVDQAAFLRQLAQTGEQGKVMEAVMAAITDKSKNMANAVLSPLGKALRDLNVNWQELMDRMSKSEAIQAIVHTVNDLVLLIERLFSAQPPEWFKVLFITGSPGMGDLATALGSQRVKQWLDPSGTVLPGSTPSVIGGATTAIGGMPANATGLQPDFQVNLRDLIAKAAEQGLNIGIGNGFRTFEKQSELFAAAVAKYGSVEAARKWVAPPGTSQHEFGRAVDLVDASGKAISSGTAEDQFLRNNISMFNIQRRMGHEPWHVEPVGAAGGATTTALTRPVSPAIVTMAAAGPNAQEPDVNKLNALLEAERRRIVSERGIGAVLTENQAKERAHTIALEKDIAKEGEAAIAKALVTNATIVLSHEIDNQNLVLNKEIEQQGQVVRAYQISAKEGKIQEGIYKAETAALQLFGRTDTTVAQNFIANRTRQMQQQERFNELLQDAKERLQARDTSETLRLQMRLVGQTTEEITRQVTILTEKQRIEREFPFLNEKEKAAKLAVTTVIADQTKRLADMNREQQRIDDMYRSIGSTIESAIGNVIDGIFDPKKAIDWGKQIKSMMTGLLKDVTMSLFVKPMIGNMLGMFGASPNVVQGFGGSVNGTGIGLGTLVQGGSLFNSASSGTGMFGSGGLFSGSLFGGSGAGSSGGMFSGVSDFFSGGAGGAFAHTPTAMDFAAGSGPVLNVPGWLGGGTTLGGAAMGVGLGFAGGTMLNSLIGGKSTGGMIGSGVGSLAGLALTPLLGPLGPILGGLAGGALGGMFGNSRPSNASAGATIDLSQFKITSGFAGGNQQIDQQVAQIGQSLQTFMDLLKTTGGKLSGSVLLQSGVNTGITVDSSLEGYSGRFNLGKDTEAATKAIEQALIKSITGVSEVMKTVLSQVGTDEDIAKAIQFAITYDDLKKAAEDAFTSIEDASKKMGPFGTAMVQIDTIFADLTTSATRFGLALEPVNAALAEATKRLQDDFLDAINLASNVANNKTYRNTIQDTINAYLVSTREASDIGLGEDVTTGNKLGQLFTDQMKELLSGLDESALRDVIAQSFEGLDSLNPLIDSLAQAAIDMLHLADATNAAADAAARGSVAYKAIADLLNSLQVHPSTFQSPEDAILAANKTFFDLFNKASEGSLEAFEGLAGASQDYIDAIEQYYGSAQAGQDTVAMIEKGLQDLLDMNPALKPQDQAVITNQLLTTLNTTSMASSNMIATNTDLLGENNNAANQAIAQNAQHSKDAIDANNKSATDTIAANKTASDAAIAANNAASATAVAANTAASNAAIAANNKGTTDAIAANNAAAATMVAANNYAAAGIIAQNDAASLALIAANDAGVASVVAENSAASAAMITANDNATSGLIANANAGTAAILSGSSADAMAIGLVTQNVGNQLSAVNTGLLNNTIAAIWGSASSIITGLYNVIIAGETATYGAANSIISADNVYANNQITATWGAVNSLISVVGIYANNQVSATYGAANSVITTAVTIANNQVAATYGAANGLIGNMTVIGNNQTAATYNAANSIIEAGRVFANGNLSAITNTQFSNEQAHAALMNLTANDDYAIYLQLVNMTTLLQQMLDALRLQRAA